MTQTTTAMAPMSMPSLCSEACSGVMFEAVSGSSPPQRPGRSAPARSAAMLPTRVRMPVATTTPRAEPLVTLQPEKTMVSGVSLPDSALRGLACLLTSSLSPVSGISSTFRSWASRSRASAGTTSPVPRIKTSPRTTALLGTDSSTPSRSTRASGCDILERASSALPAELSVAAAMPALRTTITRMAMPEGTLFTPKEATAAMISSTMMTFVSCARKSFRKPGLFCFFSSLGPSIASRSAACAPLRPSAGLTASSRRSSSMAAAS
mmetsp:Transcript_94161/g.292905  ORF Transcript_94161/g.292905 Transcript_94161/m.292905 type:complete len:265 (-) Transcript_94161:60-854(-)